jgi:hypothetical protein
VEKSAEPVPSDVESTSPGSSKPAQKLLSSSALKGTGKLTSDLDVKSVELVREGKATAPKTRYDVKKESTKPDDQAEVRMADRFAAEGYKVEFRAHDRGGDLFVDGILTDVKHAHTERIVSAITRGARQGADQVIIDGTTIKLTQEAVDVGIREFETHAIKNWKLRNIKTIYVVKGDGNIFVYHRTMSLLKAH